MLCNKPDTFSTALWFCCVVTLILWWWWGAHIPQCTYEGQRTTKKGQFSPPTKQVLFLELRSSGLATGVFIRWDILLALWCHFYYLIHFKLILMYSMNRNLKLFPGWIPDNCCNKCLSPITSVHTHVQWCELSSLSEVSISMHM